MEMIKKMHERDMLPTIHISMVTITRKELHGQKVIKTKDCFYHEKVKS